VYTCALCFRVSLCVHVCVFVCVYAREEERVWERKAVYERWRGGSRQNPFFFVRACELLVCSCMSL
jgi:hypothetical protein